MMLLLQETAIEVHKVRAAVSSPSHGAILVFEGVTRNHHEGRQVLRLSYEAYEEMALLEMERIREEALTKWPAVRIAIVHRTGLVDIGQTSLVIAVGAPHRPESYEANRFVLEAIKQRLPVWKKEIYNDGEGWKPNT